MTVSTSSAQSFATPASRRWSPRAVFREMLNAWRSHNQRLAEIGVFGHH